MLGLGHLIGLLVLIAGSVRAMCKYGHATLLSSCCYGAGVRRMAARRTGQEAEERNERGSDIAGLNKKLQAKNTNTDTPR